MISLFSAKTTTVYVSNLSEDVWPFIDQFTDSKAKAYEIEENANLSDRDLFALAGVDNLILILPKALDPLFLSYYQKLFRSKQIMTLIPKKHTGQISLDALADKDLWEKLQQLVRSAKRVNIISYTTSPQFYKFVTQFQSFHPAAVTPESPEPSEAWTINFYGSKSGIRQLSQQSASDEPDFKMTNGVIAFGIEDAAKIAAKKYSKNGGIVLKTNKGHSGAGILIYRAGDLPADYHASAKKILETLQKEAYWNKFPIIIEKYVEPQASIGGGFPNVEFKILKNGHIDLIFTGGMRVTRQGVFKGMEIFSDVLSDRIEAQITDTGFFLGEQLSREGYRGHYDVDFIAAKNGELYVTESNVRRTGGTHVYYTALALFGKNFMHETFILSNNIFDIEDPKITTFEKLYERLEPILFNPQTRDGVIIVSANLLSQRKFGYIIFGTNESRALEIEQQMEQLLRKT